MSLAANDFHLASRELRKASQTRVRPSKIDEERITRSFYRFADEPRERRKRDREFVRGEICSEGFPSVRDAFFKVTPRWKHGLTDGEGSLSNVGNGLYRVGKYVSQWYPGEIRRSGIGKLG